MLLKAKLCFSKTKQQRRHSSWESWNFFLLADKTVDWQFEDE